ncbi:serine/threonine protein kinase [Hahella sp. KA22]|uniref:ABC transporter substrate-binding protein n=1 Tax=Hahella sp. KA22 TaxID=1628392 RepID=UPI000FDEFA10|nr:ABC transporter substrate-binding protein [Hahella sp. KA22]AZZ90120.1 serine/threonine protein kinase [Hahella sp. KA22]QAY53490.1 serine/threonine protein kinase [Hahella sp. KA22]
MTAIAKFTTDTPAPASFEDATGYNAADSMIGRVLKGMYRLEYLLADGGMSRVYVARQLSLDRLVVVKVLRSGAPNVGYIQLFYREARIASQLNHPNVMQVFDFGATEDNMLYLVAEFLQGEVLSDLMEKHGNGLPLENVVWLIEQMAAGLQAAHQLNIVHRDLKPGNIMVAKVSGNHSVAKLLDFGISKPLEEQDLQYTQMGLVVGTPGYLAPEQIDSSKDIDGRADIYALGAVLYYCITGERPFNGETHHQIMAQQRKYLPQPLSDKELADPRNKILEPVLTKAMAIAPADRYESCLDMVRDLQLRARNAVRNSNDHGLKLVNLTTYAFVFAGELAEGVERAIVLKKLKTKFSISDAGLKKMFSGRRIIVRKNLSLSQAKKFQSAFKAAGAIGHVEDMNPATLVDPAHSREERAFSQPIEVDSTTLTKSLHLTRNGTSGSTSQSHSGIATQLPQAQESKRRTAFRIPAAVKYFFAGAAIVMGLLSASLLSPKVRYQLSDLNAELNGWSAPRGVNENEIRIGMSAPISEEGQAQGSSARRGVQARFEELNANGGIHGRMLTLQAFDDANQPLKSRINMQTLLSQNGSFALIGNIGAPEVLLPAIMEQQTLVIGVQSGAAALRRNPPDRYVFNFRIGYADETFAIVRHFVDIQEVEPSRIAVLYEDTASGRDGLAGMERALAFYNVHARDIPQFTYQPYIEQVEGPARLFLKEQSELQALVIIGNHAATARTINRIRKAGWEGQVAVVSSASTDALAKDLKSLEAPHTAGLIATQATPPVHSYATGVLRHRQAMQRYFPDHKPDAQSLEGYLAASLFTEALQRAGRNFDTETMVSTLESLKDIDLGIGELISFSSIDHQASENVWALQLNKSGAFEPLTLTSRSW